MLLKNDVFLKFTWIFAIFIFFSSFLYTFFKYRSFKLVAKYSFVLAIVIFVPLALFKSPSLLIQYRKSVIQYQIQIDDIKPKELLISKISDTETIIKWKTSEPTAQFIRYRDVLDKTWFIVRDSKKPTQSTKEHFVYLKNLKKGVRYIFEIRQKDKKFTDYEGKRLEIRN